MINHTPGPWIVSGPTICKLPTEAQPIVYALAHILNPYAGATGAADRVLANARLIASAPELLAALQEIVIEAGPQFGLDDHPGSINRISRLARAAIARATGADL